MDDNPLWELRGYGQGVWLDGLRRLLAERGALSRLLESYAVSGINTDLVILAGAVARGAEYRDSLARWAAGEPLARPVEALLVEEAAIAAHLLAPVHERTDGRDGYASVDVDPSLAHDAEAMAAAVQRLHSAVATANVIPRVPATDSGCAVFEALTADGHSAHVGPVFSLDAVERVTQSFVRGARRLSENTGPSARLASVVSLGLAALDEAVDELLNASIRAADRDTSGVESLLGCSAAAIAQVACRRQRHLLADSLPEGLRADGPRSLRLMWAYLTTGDPRRRRLRYVERLVGPDTVAAMPLGLMRDFAAAGAVEPTLVQRVDRAEEILEEIESLGIDLAAVGAELEELTIERLKREYGELDNVVVAATEAVGADQGRIEDAASWGSPWSASEAEIPAALIKNQHVDDRLPTRLWEKDASLWSDDPATREVIRNRLGWLDLIESTPSAGSSVRRFVDHIERGEVEDVVLLGTGGSSLCAEVCRQVFAGDRLWIVDNAIPAQVSAVVQAADLPHTLVVVASKSGTTIEIQALLDFFYARAAPMMERPGDRFVAITDPGTPLEQAAHERGFRRLWLTPTDVGGRFSALSAFGTLPMELMGIDSAAIHAAARRMAASCAAGTCTSVNPGTRLGVALFDAHECGRDKLTLSCSPSLTAFGLWVEQLVAESTGKESAGLVPIIDEPRDEADRYGEDRVFVALELAGEGDPDREEWLDALCSRGHPVMRFVLDDRHEIGAEFVRWQIAVSTAGSLMGVNPFDQPNVQESKDRTKAILSAYENGTPMSDRAPVAMDVEWAVFADLERDEALVERQTGADLEGWMRAHLGRAEVPDYVALQAFVAREPRTQRALEEIRRLLLERRGVASTLGWGPAFLHSTGQLHKGGPDHGVFLQITSDDEEDIEVPHAGYTLGQLVRAQSLGDLAALEERGRRVLRVHVSDAVRGVEMLLEAVERGIR